MKKVLLTAFAAMALMAMTACNNNKAAEATEDTTCAATEQCEKKCCKAEGDSTMCCKAEGMAMDSTKACCKEGQEGCQKAEGKKCCKAEGKECEKKCEKAQ